MGIWVYIVTTVFDTYSLPESGTMTLGLIYLDEKPAGARSAGNLHAACDVAGTGNVLSLVARQFSTLPVAESFFASLKKERVQWKHYQTRADAQQDILDYIAMFYNSRRLHSTLDYISPNDFESVMAERKKAA